MSYNAISVRSAGLSLVLLSPGREAVRTPASYKLPCRSGSGRPPTRPVRHRLPISRWEAQSWTKKIVKGRVGRALISNRRSTKRTDDLE